MVAVERDKNGHNIYYATLQAIVYQNGTVKGGGGGATQSERGAVPTSRMSVFGYVGQRGL